MSNQYEFQYYADELPIPDWVDDCSFQWFFIHVGEQRENSMEYSHTFHRFKIVDSSKEGRFILSDTVTDLEKAR